MEQRVQSLQKDEWLIGDSVVAPHRENGMKKAKMTLNKKKGTLLENRDQNNSKNSKGRSHMKKNGCRDFDGLVFRSVYPNPIRTSKELQISRELELISRKKLSVIKPNDDRFNDQEGEQEELGRKVCGGKAEKRLKFVFLRYY